LSKEEITLTRSQEKPSASLAQMLKGQYTSKEFNDILTLLIKIVKENFAVRE